MLQSFGHPKGLQDINDSCNNKGLISSCNNLATKAYAFGPPKGLEDINDFCHSKGHMSFCNNLAAKAFAT
jgi:hypothetical protein